jgi:hypothetical protein
MKNKPLFILLLSGALLLSLSATYYLLSQQVTVMKQTAFEKGQAVIAASEKVLSYSEKHEVVSALSSQEERIRGRLVGQEEVVLFIESLETTARALNAEFEVVSVETEKGDDPRLILSYRARGTFNSLMQLHTSIEFGTKSTHVASVSLDGEGLQWTLASVLSVSMRK